MHELFKLFIHNKRDLKDVSSRVNSHLAFADQPPETIRLSKPTNEVDSESDEAPTFLVRIEHVGQGITEISYYAEDSGRFTEIHPPPITETDDVVDPSEDWISTDDDQNEAIKQINSLRSAVAIHGPWGTGKTLIAMIALTLRKWYHCDDSSGRKVTAVLVPNSKAAVAVAKTLSTRIQAMGPLHLRERIRRRSRNAIQTSATSSLASVKNLYPQK